MEKVGGEGRGRVLGGVSLACEVARARALAWPLRWRVGATAPSSCRALEVLATTLCPGPR